MRFVFYSMIILMLSWPDAFAQSDAQPTTRILEPDASAENHFEAGKEYLNSRYYVLARAEFELALELAPTDWEIWGQFGLANQLAEHLNAASIAYSKMLELHERCEDGSASPCIVRAFSEQIWPIMLRHAAQTFLRVGEYDHSAEAYRQAISLTSDDQYPTILGWLAVARAGATDVKTAWREYKKLLRGEPFPNHNQDNLTRKRARRMREPPEGFYRMLMEGFKSQRNWSYSLGHNYYEYFHAQNVSRTEALYEISVRTGDMPRSYESPESRDYVIAVFKILRINVEEEFTGDETQRFWRLPVANIHPALSRYAVEAAKQAERAVDRGRFQKAEDLYRLALASDPWWIQGQFNLAHLEFINYGYCGPMATLDVIEALLVNDVYDSFQPSFRPNMSRQYLNHERQVELEIWREAKASGSARLEHWCDVDVEGFPIPLG